MQREYVLVWESDAFSLSHSQSLLPNPGILILDRIERETDRFRWMVHVEHEPRCPVCACISRSPHSSYCRCLQDLPWQGVSVQICVTVDRFRCRNRGCPRRIFFERLPQVASAYARQTTRTSENLYCPRLKRGHHHLVPPTICPAVPGRRESLRNMPRFS